MRLLVTVLHVKDVHFKGFITSVKKEMKTLLNMFFVINLLSVRMSDVSYELSYQLSALVSCNQDLDKDLTLTQA